MLATNPSDDANDAEKMREMMRLEESLDADITRAIGDESEDVIDHNADKKIIAVLSLANQPVDSDHSLCGATCSDNSGTCKCLRICHNRLLWMSQMKLRGLVMKQTLSYLGPASTRKSVSCLVLWVALQNRLVSAIVWRRTAYRAEEI